ncbi:MAG: hypothetical protein NDI75_04705 [Candidatus Didemnitutus sp.]|nr:hypothetical protein [Candidatus Didemnitutus sp.]
MRSAFASFPALRDIVRAGVLLFVFTLCAALPLRAQLSYTTPEAPLVETFDAGLPAALNTAVPWTDNVTFTGWYAQFDLTGTPATYRISNTPSNNQIQQFRNAASATDGALGGRAADTAGPIYYAVRLRNTTGVTLRTFTLRYALEQWSRSTATITNSFTVTFRLGDPANLQDGFWAPLQYAATDAPSFDGTEATTLNGSFAANRTVSQTLTVGGLAWEPGTDLWIRFQDANDGGIDHGIALDDVVFTASTSTDVPVGGVIFGRNRYIEIHPGDIPLIIAAPHGGLEEPADIADRTYGVFERDINTQDMARRMVAEIYARTGKRPHLIMSLIHRRKLDPNRDIVVAAQGDPNAEIAWNEYHGAIATARASAESNFGFGLLVDTHGHGHTIQRIELGYVVRSEELDLSDQQLEHPAYAENSSCRTHAHLPGVHFPSFLRGPRSLGALFVARGYPAVPSPDMPSPAGAAYFDGTGGYTSEAQGSRIHLDNVQAFLMETHWTGLRDTTAARVAFARTFATAINAFLYDQWGYALGSGSLFRLSASAATFAESGAPRTLTVTRSGHLGEEETIALAFSGTATLAEDYTASATSLTFAPGETEKTLTLTPIDDAAAEGAETLAVALVPTALQTADVLPVELLLTDDELATVQLTSARASFSEGGDPLEITLTRDLTADALTATVQFTGRAVRGRDYAVTGLDASNQVTFGPGDTTRTLTLTALPNTRLDPVRTLTLAVEAGPAHRGGPALTLARGDDDLPADLALWLADRIEDDVWRDDSAHGRDAALKPSSASLPTVADATAGRAVEFDGAKTAAVAPRLALGTSGFTLAFRFRLDASGTANGERHLLNLGTPPQPASLNVFLAEADGMLRTVLGDTAANPATTTLAVPAPAAGTWQHYALTVSPAGAVQIYLDGVPTASTAAPAVPVALDAPLWLGWSGGTDPSPHRHHRGGLADVRLYTRALAPAEVAALHAPSEPPLSAWEQWRRDNFSAPELADAALSGAAADADADGLANALEFALALDPHTPGTSGAPALMLDANRRLTLSFVRRALPEIIYDVQASDDLQTWTSLWSSTGAANTAGPVTVTDDVAFDATTRRFLRLAITTP